MAREPHCEFHQRGDGMSAPPKRKSRPGGGGSDLRGVRDLHLNTRNRTTLQATPAARRRLGVALWGFPWAMSGWPAARIVRRVGHRLEVVQ